MPDWILYAIIIVLFSERIGKLIPDHKEGLVGYIRGFFKFVSLYTPNVR